MEQSRLNESQLARDLERLRQEHPQTQDLYREVCILLFFRYGVTPTANKLYQLVRKGSMSAPAEALGRFWEDLREKSRVRIEHPDLPEELKAAAAELTATLWNTAQAAARSSLAACEEEARSSVLQAQKAQQAAEVQHERAERAVEQSRQQLDDARRRIQALEQERAADFATRNALETQLEQMASEYAALQRRMDEARREFATELEKLHAAAERREERIRASETRALLEIDRERTAAARSQKELEQVRAASSRQADKYLADLSRLQEQLGEALQKNGMLAGSLRAADAEKQRLSSELDVLRGQFTAQTSQLAVAAAAAENWRCRAEEAQKALQELPHLRRRRTFRERTPE